MKLKNSLLVILALICFFLLGIIYIQKTYINIPYQDGFMPIPVIEKYFKGNLSFNDLNMRWGEHRLVGFSLIYIFNSIFFRLDTRVDAYIFLLTYISIGAILYFFYNCFFKNNLKRNFAIWIQISYVSILSIIFSLVHPPLMSSMTVQFVLGTLCFVILSLFFDQICINGMKFISLLGLVISMLIYILIFSGAYFGGALFSLIACIFFKSLHTKNSKSLFELILPIIFMILLIGVYMYLTPINTYDRLGLFDKLSIFALNFGDTFKALLVGLSSTTLDIHTFSERLGRNEFIAILNGFVLLILGIYSLFIFIRLKIYNKTYLPFLLMMYSLGSILTIRLGRLNGGWLQVSNDWYSFHLYFYLVGALWILYFDLFKRFDAKIPHNLKYFFKHNKLYILTCIFFVITIFSVQIFSNISQWQRAPFIKIWLAKKRDAILSRSDKSIELLLWDKEKLQKAKYVMKKYKLSVFR